MFLNLVSCVSHGAGFLPRIEAGRIEIASIILIIRYITLYRMLGLLIKTAAQFPPVSPMQTHPTSFYLTL
jgi:hypothetical protein